MMHLNLHKKNAEIFIPDGSSKEVALQRTTHLACVAHQDDIEILAIDGILKAYQNPITWFSGIVMTNGSGSPRAGIYQNYTDEEMVALRRKEQQKAALVGDYSSLVSLNYSSAEVKNNTNPNPIEDLVEVLTAASPEIVYTHNPADKHDTHVAVALRLIKALRRLPPNKRPKHVYGCEAWRDLDWLLDRDKVVFNVSTRENLQMALISIFDSQISGGKRYDLATMARRRAHATYYTSHGVDSATGLVFAMDLTPLIQDDSLNVQAFVLEYIQNFAEDVKNRLARLRF